MRRSGMERGGWCPDVPVDLEMGRFETRRKDVIPDRACQKHSWGADGLDLEGD